MKRSAHMRITTTDAEAGGYVISNLASSTSFLADQQTVDFINAVDRLGSSSAASKELGIDPTQAEQFLARLINEGILVQPGSTHVSEKPKRPFETRLIFFRLDLLDIAPIVRWLLPILRLAFTKGGLILWLVLVVAAIASLTRDASSFSAAVRSLLNLSWQGGLVLVLVFALLKVVHELGHAAALWLFSQKEGIEVGTIRAGISFFALFPFPYTDATAAWQLQNKYRRAGIALSGIYLESWIAAIAAIAWAHVTPGETQSILFQVLLVSGISTVLFNLNPLVRLDGYYVFSDLASRPNLATRAARSARAVGAWMLGGTMGEVSRFHLCYWALSYSYRWVIFAGVFWIAYTVDPRMGLPVAVIALITLVVRPVIGTAKQAWSGPVSVPRIALTVFGVAAIVIGSIVPVPDTYHAYGTLSRYEAQPVRPDHNALVTSVATAGLYPAEYAVLQMESPTVDVNVASLKSNAERLMLAIRTQRSQDAAMTERLTGDLRAIETQLAAMQEVKSNQVIALQRGEYWEPSKVNVERTWVSAHTNTVLGHILRPVPAFVTVELKQSEADFAELLPLGVGVEARGRHNLACKTEVTVSQFRPVRERSRSQLELLADLRPEDPCFSDLNDGAEVILRLERPDSSLTVQLYRAASRMAQNRLPTPETTQ